MNRSDYLAKARHNEEFLESIDKNRFCDWWVTASFYVALHYVNAFVSVSIKSGFCSHEKIKNILHPQGSFTDLRFPRDKFEDYMLLQNLSRKARYMQVGDHEDSVCRLMKPKHVQKAEKLMNSVRTYVLSRQPKDDSSESGK